MPTKTKKTARKRTVRKSAGTAPVAAPKKTADVHVHPSLVEIRFDGESGPSERLGFGALGSDAYQEALARIKALQRTHSVTIRNFNAQGVESL